MDLRIEARARFAESEPDPSRLIHRDTAHPPVAAIGRIRALLEDARIAAGDPQLVPADADRRAGGDAVVHDERLVIAEVAVGEPVHEPVGERVEPLSRAELRDTGSAAARFGVRVDPHAARTRERRVARRGPVDVELPADQAAGGAESDHVVGRAGRRQARAVERRGEQSAVRGARSEELLRCRLPREHARAVERGDAGAGEVRAVREDVDREVVAVRPDPELRIVREVGVAVVERIAVIGAGRVRRRGDRDAHEVGERADRELADHPAIGDAVVDHAGIAIVIGLAAAPKAGPDAVDRGGAEDRAAALVEHREACVHGLHVVVRADGAVRVGRRRAHREGPLRAGEAPADALERADQSGRARGRRHGGARLGALRTVRRRVIVARYRTVRLFFLVLVFVLVLVIADKSGQRT